MALKLYIENGESNPAAQYVDDGAPPSGYTDKETDIVSWGDYGSRTKRDYLFIMEKIKTNVKAIAGSSYENMNLLSAAEKLVAATYIFKEIPYADFTAIITDAEHRKQTIRRCNKKRDTASEKRINKILDITEESFEPGDVTTILDKIGEDNLKEKLRTRCSNLIYYFDGVAPYVGTGVRDSGFTPKDGRTLTVVCDEVAAIKDEGA